MATAPIASPAASPFAPDLQHYSTPEAAGAIPYGAVAAVLGRFHAKASAYCRARSSAGKVCDRPVRARLAHRSRVHPDAARLVDATPGFARSPRHAAAKARADRALHRVRHALHAVAGAVGHGGKCAHRRILSMYDSMQQIPQRLRASFRRRKAGAGPAHSVARPASGGTRTLPASLAATASRASLPGAVSSPRQAGNMADMYRLTLQDTLRNSAVTASFFGDGMTLENLDACLGSPSRQPLRHLVTGLKMALDTTLPAELVTASVNPVRAALWQDDTIRMRFTTLLRDFPLVQTVAARLTPWGNSDNLEKKLAAMSDDAAALHCSPEQFFLMCRARALGDDIQYTRRFLLSLEAILASA